MAMHTFSFRLGDEDQGSLNALVEALQEETGLDVKASDVLRMLVRKEAKRRASGRSGAPALQITAARKA